VRRRGRLQLIRDTLKVARRGASRTRIVYGANLNFKILAELEADLERNGLLEHQGRILKATSKGLELLKVFRQIEQICAT